VHTRKKCSQREKAQSNPQSVHCNIFYFYEYKISATEVISQSHGL